MDKYEGWANYPTWNLYNWLTGDEAAHDRWRLTAAESWESAGHDPARAAHYLGELIRGAVKADDPTDTGWYGDVMGWAIGIVDYTEVAAALLEEVTA